MFFLNESLQTAFPNNVLISKFQDECGPSVSARLEERGEVSGALSHLKNDTMTLVWKELFLTG